MRFVDTECRSGPYPVPVGLMFTPAEWEAEKKRRDIVEENNWDGTRSCVRKFKNQNGSQLAYICLADLSRETFADAMGSVAHEATHAWQTIRDAIGEHEPALEQEAYMIGWITKWVIEHLFIWEGPKGMKRLLMNRPTNGS